VPTQPPTADTLIVGDLERCQPASALGTAFGRGRWRLLPYRAEGITGHMLGAGQESAAPAVAYPLECRGRHAISIGIFNGFWRPYREQRVDVRLESERDWTTLTLSPPSGLPWGIPIDDDESGPRITEVPWRTADLSGERIHIRQPSHAPWASQIRGTLGSEVYVAYIRLDPVPSGDDAWPRRELELFGYADTWDPFFERSRPMSPTEGREAVRAAISPYRDTDFTRLYWEVSHGEVAHFPTRVGRSWADYPPDAFPRLGDRLVVETWRDWQADGFDPLATAIEAAGDAGIELHVAHRFGWGAFYWPPPFDAYNRDGLFERHPGWRVRRRDGSLDTALSFAYPEVRAFTVALLREAVSRPVDGLALLFNRTPPFVGHDPPLVESFRVAAGVDPGMLAPDDRAWLLHRSGAVTEFVREVRTMLDEAAIERGRARLPLTAWVFGTIDDNLAFGLDVESWIREGLIDTVVPYSSQPGGFSWGPSWEDDAEIEPWTTMTDGTGCLLAPNLMPRDLDEVGHRRVALRLARAGVRALSFWDTAARQPFTSGVLARLGRVDELKAWEEAGSPSTELRTRRLLDVAGWAFEHLPE
jgi:hypothetical protein